MLGPLILVAVAEHQHGVTLTLEDQALAVQE
jgi:hypothetical protein